jgi:peptidoglycan/LPS O-acetylase OafA/YrhL
MSKLFNRSSSNYAFIDGIRAIAVLWVIFFHAWLFQYFSMPGTIDKIYDYPLFYWVTKGDLGVDLFFVISGFLIGGIIFKEIKTRDSFNFKRFYVRRFLRLTPVYIAAIFMNLYFLASFGQDNLLAYWPNILYINNYVPTAPMGWTWSLAIEEQFYIVVPFLLVFIFPKFRNKTSFFVVLSAISISLSWYYVYILRQYSLPLNLTFFSNEWKAWFSGYYVLTHLRYIGLLLGVATAYLTVYKSDETKAFFEKKSGGIFFSSILVVILLIIISFTPIGEWMPMKKSIFNDLNIHVGRWYEILVRPVFSALIAFIIISCIYGNNVIINGIRNILSAKFFYPIAQVSYSAYLFHEMFIVWAAPKLYAYLTPNYSNSNIFFITTFVSLIVILLASVIMYYVIEQPFQKIRDKFKFN